MTGWGSPVHPVKEIENTSTTNVVVEICQFDEKVPVCFFLINFTSNALSKVTPRLPRLSINFALFCWFCNGKPAHWKLRISCLGSQIEIAGAGLI